ncbi:MAG: 4Fe-4S dicluster domain-containing protein [Lachnospiraceae bacterium]|nr:4Fe-4S dicluster domain-containing protein [Lachnospiraceae bacterium]
MEIKELQNIIQACGVVGAGGAGFPTYMKLTDKADTILMNCAECEPLLKLHRQLLERHAYEIMKTFHMIAETLGASEAIIGVKKSYVQTVRALEQHIEEFPGMRIHLLDEVYPMGDEVVLIYEATGRVVRPGGLPIEQGVAVFNVETVYNVYRAVEENKPVTDKYVSVVAEVSKPVTVRVPLGCTLDDVVAQAGTVTVKDPVYFVGGPMMGRIGTGDEPVTKTTNAILVLPRDHIIVMKKQRTSSVDLKRAASICCQCSTCTDLCPRSNLGHPIDPARFMRAASNQDFQDLNPYLDASFCSSCGVCEMYACPQSLAPRSLLADMKLGLRKAGIKPPQNAQAVPVKPSREYRKVPEERLKARLGLSRYDVDAPMDENLVSVPKVKVLLNQHIGAPARAIVKVGDEVTRGQMIAEPAQGLSVGIHATICGKVTEVTDRHIVITANQKGRA